MDSAYFTWPDGRFRYECRGCGACCKGHGIGIDVAAGQLVQLLGKRPELAAFVRRRGDAVTAFNPRDRCWFLEDDGLCRIEVEDGRAAKPASCRLFPFNRVFRIGAYTVVDFNSVICPLQLVDEGGVTHAEILAEVATIQDPAIVGTQLPPDDALISREQAIAGAIFAPAAEPNSERDGSATGPETETGGPRLAPEPEMEGEGLRPAPGIDAAWTAQDASPLAAATATTTSAFDAILGTPWRRPGSTTLSAALHLTPSMRFNELYGPRQYAPRARVSPVLARMWLAWLGFAALGEALAQRALGLQELTTIWSEQAPLMHAIARWTDAPAMKPGPIELPNVDPGNLVRGLGQRCVDNRKARQPLGELVAATLAGAEPAARVAALKLADPILRAAFAG